jgi:SAM-dependent methyltransferase
VTATRHNDGRFDEEYYRRFYERPETRASGPDEFRRLSQFVFGYVEYLEIPIREVLDLGCGLGRWKAAVAARYPEANYTGVDPSPYLVERFGWVRGTADGFRSRRKYDLIICQDVLPYLDRRGIKDALANIARLTRGAAYIQIVTSQDWDNGVVDPDRTDHAMNRLDADWWRRQFRRHFVNCGGGIFLGKDAEVALWEMEKVGES